MHGEYIKSIILALPKPVFLVCVIFGYFTRVFNMKKIRLSFKGLTFAITNKTDTFKLDM